MVLPVIVSSPLPCPTVPDGVYAPGNGRRDGEKACTGQTSPSPLRHMFAPGSGRESGSLTGGSPTNTTVSPSLLRVFLPFMTASMCQVGRPSRSFGDPGRIPPGSGDGGPEVGLLRPSETSARPLSWAPALSRTRDHQKIGRAGRPWRGLHRIAAPWGRVPGAQVPHHPAISLPAKPAGPTIRSRRPSSRHLRALGASPGPSWPRHHRRRPLPGPASCRHTVFARPPRSGGPRASSRALASPYRVREVRALCLCAAGRMRGRSRGRSDGHRSARGVPGHGTATNGRTRRGTVVPIRRGSVEGRVPLPSRHTA